MVDLVAGRDAKRDGALVRPVSDLVNLHFVDSFSLGRLRLSPGFFRQVKTLIDRSGAGHADLIIHDHGLWGLNNIAAARAAHGCDVPYILHPRGMLEPWALQYKGTKKRLAWSLYQRRIAAASKVLVATSEQELASLKQLLPDSPVALIPNGVTVPSEAPDSSPRRGREQARLLFMSRVHPVKNLLGLVKAWEQVCRDPSRSRWVLQIAGPDELDHTREVKALVDSLGLHSRVEFVGQVPESGKTAAYRNSDLFVLPSFTENFGVVVAEALAHGLPVVTTTGTPWQKLVEFGCGWWVDPSSDALAGALAQAVDLPDDDRRAMGLRGYEYSVDALSWDHVGVATVRLYEWVLNKDSPTPEFVYA